MGLPRYDTPRELPQAPAGVNPFALAREVYGPHVSLCGATNDFVYPRETYLVDKGNGRTSQGMTSGEAMALSTFLAYQQP